MAGWRPDRPPGQYRAIDDLVRGETQGGGSLELLSLKEAREDEETM